ncbi:MAG: winged helix-turn-helix domain-containing protein [Lentisphaerae bacterium]|nr:winged helix-turn-helix domain-containing protein [Lentisphaerota bacterium]
MEILGIIKAAGRATNRDVAARFQVSAASANRLLTDMTARGIIRSVMARIMFCPENL